MQKYNKAAADGLCRAFLTLGSVEECGRFLEDICTIQEVEALSQRLDVARYLRRGMSYFEVNELTGASTATIGRVSKCVNYGSGGYGIVLDRLGEAEDNDR